LQILFGSLNIFLGILFLILPIIFIEFARQKDFIKASLFLLLGIFLLLSSDIFKFQYLLILIINSLISTFLVYEVFSNRWIQLSQKEKKEFENLKSIKVKLILFFDAIKKLFKNIYTNYPKLNFLKNDVPSKKWVRSEKKDSNNNSDQLKFNSSFLDLNATNIPKKDIINDDKN